MALLGKAAMVLAFDIAPQAIAEHDDWHTHEHIPERRSIPGFLRASRWSAAQAGPGYFVLYEVEELAVLTSAAYLERLNNPTPWTAKMMTHYRGMNRGFCRVTCSLGLGMAQAGLLVRFKPAPGAETALRTWLVDEELPGLPSTPGLAGAHLLEGALAPPGTNEQRIRGNDAAVDWALLVTGYRPETAALLFERELSRERFERMGATGVAGTLYRMEYFL